MFLVIELVKCLMVGIMVIFAIEIAIQTSRIDKMTEEQEYKLFHFEGEGHYKKDVKRINALM